MSVPRNAFEYGCLATRDGIPCDREAEHYGQHHAHGTYWGEYRRPDPPRDAKGDPINPSHYKANPSGVECITVVEHMSFNLGNAIKYIWRAGLKSENAIEDLKKGIWYLEREISRLERK